MSPTVLRIYHNNRCSKSRAACQLIAEKGVAAEIVDYLKTPPTRDELRELLGKLGMPAAELTAAAAALGCEQVLQIDPANPTARNVLAQLGAAPSQETLP